MSCCCALRRCAPCSLARYLSSSLSYLHQHQRACWTRHFIQLADGRGAALRGWSPVIFRLCCRGLWPLGARIASGRHVAPVSPINTSRVDRALTRAHSAGVYLRATTSAYRNALRLGRLKTDSGISRFCFALLCLLYTLS
jgi:hypothetical protein